MLRASLFIALIVCICATNAIKPNLCKQRMQAKIDTISIDDCSEYPCLLKKGKEPSINLQLTPKRTIRGASLKIAGKINGREIPFMADDNNHCESSITDYSGKSLKKCLLRKGQNYKYKFSLPVKAEYPSMSLSVKYELVDKNGRSIVCFVFPATIEA